MGRVERATGSALGLFIVCAIALIPLFWPLLLQGSIGAGAAWAVEVVWIAVLGVVAVFWYRHNKAKQLQRMQAQADFERHLAEHRAYMASTGRPWFDAA